MGGRWVGEAGWKAGCAAIIGDGEGLVRDRLVQARCKSLGQGRAGSGVCVPDAGADAECPHLGCNRLRRGMVRWWVQGAFMLLCSRSNAVHHDSIPHPSSHWGNPPPSSPFPRTCRPTETSARNAPKRTAPQGTLGRLGEWVELSNGCMCCAVKNDFVQALETLMGRREGFDYILIETTGERSCATVGWFFFWAGGRMKAQQAPDNPRPSLLLVLPAPSPSRTPPPPTSPPRSPQPRSRPAAHTPTRPLRPGQPWPHRQRPVDGRAA